MKKQKEEPKIMFVDDVCVWINPEVKKAYEAILNNRKKIEEKK